ncbi:pyrrolo-quinoline quinone [Salinadaptatus halalkaliphilus]|uniref:Pyrrolo-quinoline quinone n=2 Tax=Salinadaptatus halalkaliphilus TaxID=2419781 RepID=A0A4V3VLJ4_9EURY|nr:pyrrolo-quinoline quinone [Salinadaptatus halalkaliphilus]
MAGYDLAGTGYNPDASGPSDDVEIVWEHDATDWFRGAAPPILLDGTLYAAGDGLVALEAETGEGLFGVRGPYTSSLAQVAADAYRTETLAATATSGIYGLNAGGGLEVPFLETRVGAHRWTGPGHHPRGPSIGPHPSIDPRPSVDPVATDGTVYAPVHGTNDLVAVDANDGSAHWRITHHEDDPVSVSFARPAIRDGLLFVANWPYQVTAYDRTDGALEWRRELEDQMQLSTVATEAGVVVTSRNGVTLLDRATGDTVWRRDLEGNATDGTAAVADGTIFLSDGRETFYALDLESGEQRWSAPFERETTPVVADGVVYAVEHGARLVGFDADTGEERFRYEPPEVPLSPPIVGDGVLYAVNRERIVALEEVE